MIKKSTKKNIKFLPIFEENQSVVIPSTKRELERVNRLIESINDCIVDGRQVTYFEVFIKGYLL